ncbi:MAG: hypothetical protein Q9175_001526 [Cornicularia normoerica]
MHSERGAKKVVKELTGGPLLTPRSSAGFHQRLILTIEQDKSRATSPLPTTSTQNCATLGSSTTALAASNLFLFEIAQPCLLFAAIMQAGDIAKDDIKTICFTFLWVPNDNDQFAWADDSEYQPSEISDGGSTKLELSFRSRQDPSPDKHESTEVHGGRELDALVPESGSGHEILAFGPATGRTEELELSARNIERVSQTSSKAEHSAVPSNYALWTEIGVDEQNFIPEVTQKWKYQSTGGGYVYSKCESELGFAEPLREIEQDPCWTDEDVGARCTISTKVYYKTGSDRMQTVNLIFLLEKCI